MSHDPARIPFSSLVRVWRLAYYLALLAIFIGVIYSVVSGQAGRAYDCPIMDLQLEHERPTWYETYQRCWVRNGDTGLVPDLIAGNLEGDTFGIVPGYMLALVLLTIATLWPCNRFARHWACVAPVAAGLFDWLENGLLFQAAAGANAHRLADSLVHNLWAVATTKWILIAISCGTLSVFIYAQGRAGFAPLKPAWLWEGRITENNPRLGKAAAGLSLISAALLFAGLHYRPALQFGVGSMVAMLLLVPFWIKTRKLEQIIDPSQELSEAAVAP